MFSCYRQGNEHIFSIFIWKYIYIDIKTTVLSLNQTTKEFDLHIDNETLEIDWIREVRFIKYITFFKVDKNYGIPLSYIFKVSSISVGKPNIFKQL